MNVKFKIIKLDLDQHSAVVRYYTDKVTEEMLATFRDPKSGAIINCATDYNFNLPVDRPLSAVELKAFLEERAPRDWLAIKEAILDPFVDTSMGALQAMVGQENLTQAVLADTRTPLEKAQAAKLAEIAAWRYAQEVNGVNVGGANIRTDRESQGSVGNALQSLKEGFVTTVSWKAANGWVELGLPQIEGIAHAVAQHVAACFRQERQLAELVDAATTVEEVQAISMPLSIEVGVA